MIRHVVAERSTEVIDSNDNRDDDRVALPLPHPIVGGPRGKQCVGDDGLPSIEIEARAAVRIPEEERIADDLRAGIVPGDGMRQAGPAEEVSIEVISIDHVVESLPDFADRERVEDAGRLVLVHRDRVDEQIVLEPVRVRGP